MEKIVPAVVILSRRNLLTLLSKLDRKKAGEFTTCTLIKHDPETVVVIAKEDAEYYVDREPGEVHPLDIPPSEK